MKCKPENKFMKIIYITNKLNIKFYLINWKCLKINCKKQPNKFKNLQVKCKTMTSLKNKIIFKSSISKIKLTQMNVKKLSFF